MELAPVFRQRFFAANGDPLAGGLLYSYEAGTSTPKTTYTNRGGLTANANPIVLDANGECDVWIGSGYYKFVLKNSAGTTQWTEDSVSLPSEAALASAFWRDIVYLTSADSPRTIAQADNGKLFVCDTSSAAITITLPEINAVTLPFNIGVKLKTAGNTLTIARSGTDLINSATTWTTSTAGVGVQVVGDIDKSPDEWETIDFGTVADFGITSIKKVESYRSVSTSVNLANTDGVVYVDASGADRTMTLPAAATVGIAGRIYYIKKIDTSANKVIIDANASETIDGELTYELAYQNESVTIHSNGTNWTVLNEKMASYWSGYFAQIGTENPKWSVASATFADGTLTGTATLTTRKTANFGTVSAAAGSKCGFTFTPKSASAVYLITATAILSCDNGLSGEYVELRMWDGTTTISTTSDISGSGNTEAPSALTILGIYVPGSASAKTITLQLANSAGTAVQITNTASAASTVLAQPVEFTVLRVF